MSGDLSKIAGDKISALYRLPAAEDSHCLRLIATTPQTRAICNDPLVFGCDYTTSLKEGVKAAFSLLKEAELFPLKEEETVVFNILRGGLNFSLREALYEAFAWNLHKSAFISSQRMKASEESEDWIISENSYSKISFDKHIAVLLGDVVATGTSLEFALNHLVDRLKKENSELTRLIFFTIGGARSHKVIERLEKESLAFFPSYKGSVVIYLEGVFGVANPHTPVRIKLHGTDLLRRDGKMAPLFVDSQYDNPAFPLERCTIYDAGSRAFDVPEYIEDVINYWSEVQKLAQTGLEYKELLIERMPEADASRFLGVSLLEVAGRQLEKLQSVAKRYQRKAACNEG